MALVRTNFELFSLGDGVEGTPQRLPPASFSALGALEVQHMERWIRERPLLLGEELKVVTNQFGKFEGAKDRLDVLAVDRAGRLVVVEIKRETSGGYQDLQALRYAAFASTFRADQLTAAHASYIEKAEGRKLDPGEARAELEAFIEGGDLGVVDEDERPRIILIATGFQPAVTSTVLWLRRTFEVDMSCVQLVPYEVGGQLVVASSILIPLPEAEDYDVKVAEKLQAATKRKDAQALLNHEKAKEFIASVPAGRWTAYGDVAEAGGSPKGAMGVGSWLRASKPGEVPNVYRVLHATGDVSGGWKAADPSLPSDPAGVRALLAQEGVEFDENGCANESQRWRVTDWLAQPSSDGGRAGTSRARSNEAPEAGSADRPLQTTAADAA